MTKHLDKTISSISYNFLNLPNIISYSNGQTFYEYRADGVKIRKINAGVSATGKTEYLDGFQYNTPVTDIVCKLQFVTTAEGYYDFIDGRYVYNYTDHLGNVRLSYYKNPTTGSAEALEENNYYPFGLKHDGYNKLSGNTGYQYKYNGKELQETGMYDYGARFYMPDIGRWGVVDSFSENGYDRTHYGYVSSNPINLIDPDGNWEDDYGIDQNGNVTLIQKTDDNFDRLYVAKSDKNGNAVLDSNGNAQKEISGEGKEGVDYVKVNKADKSSGSIISGLAKNTPISEKGFSKGINYDTTNNVNDALSVFSFAAKNSNVEWGLNATSSSTTVFTGHEAFLTPSYFFNKNVGYNVFEMHSHKNLNKPSMGPGGGVGDDYTSVLTGYLAHKNAPNKPTYSPMSFLLYAPNKGSMNLWKYWATDKGYGNKNMGTVTVLTLTVDTIYK